jgi:hypothetical protein
MSAKVNLPGRCQIPAPLGRVTDFYTYLQVTRIGAEDPELELVVVKQRVAGRTMIIAFAPTQRATNKARQEHYP